MSPCTSSFEALSTYSRLSFLLLDFYPYDTVIPAVQHVSNMRVWVCQFVVGRYCTRQLLSLAVVVLGGRCRVFLYVPGSRGACMCVYVGGGHVMYVGGGHVMYMRWPNLRGAALHQLKTTESSVCV